LLLIKFAAYQGDGNHIQNGTAFSHLKVPKSFVK